MSSRRNTPSPSVAPLQIVEEEAATFEIDLELDEELLASEFPNVDPAATPETGAGLTLMEAFGDRSYLDQARIARQAMDALIRGDRDVFGALPEPPTEADVPYANCRPELANKKTGHFLVWLVGTRAWREVVTPRMAEVDRRWAETSKNRGARRYTSEQLEYVFAMRWCSGKLSMRQARKELAGEDGSIARQLLFRDLRPRYGGTVCDGNVDGVPCESGLSRHRQRFPDSERELMLAEFLDALNHEHMDEFPEMREEVLLTGMDGKLMATKHPVPMMVPPEKGHEGPKNCLNWDEILVPDGGYIGKNNAAQHGGHHGAGFAHVALVTATGIPLAIDVEPYHSSETHAGVRLVEHYARTVRPHAAPKPAVLSADGGFNTPRLRAACRRAGMIENCHPQSHGATLKRVDRLLEAGRKLKPIEGHDGWYADELREPHCSCGPAPKVSRRFRINANGSLSARTIGECPKCGSACLTSGDYRVATNGAKWVRCHPNDPPEKRDWLLGHPLTYNDRLARIYGSDRFGCVESYNSSLANRFQICAKKPRSILSLNQARIEAYGVACVQHAITMQYRRIIAAKRAGAPPPPHLRPAPEPAAPELALAA
ncbi:MAG: transposase [Solirubrobacteraceae bacterium]